MAPVKKTIAQNCNKVYISLQNCNKVALNEKFFSEIG